MGGVFGNVPITRFTKYDVVVFRSVLFELSVIRS
jgi:hypothetical protein